MEPIAKLRIEAKEFAAQGGDERLFWTGRMSDLVGQLLRSNLRDASPIATLLEQVKREYDELIFAAANKPKS
jgi:hypothetical protein